jgi:hypothetical protein
MPWWPCERTLGAMRTIPSMCLAGALMFTACGGDDDAGAGGQANQADQPSSAADAAAAAEAAANAAGSGGGSAADLPDDVCALLTEDEVAQVAPGATAEADLASSSGFTGATCAWNNPTTQFSLTLYTGLSPEQMGMTPQIGVNDSNGEFVDVGADNDAGIWSDSPVGLELAVVHGKILVVLEVVGQGARDQKAAVTDLARSVIDRL